MKKRVKRKERKEMITYIIATIASNSHIGCRCRCACHFSVPFSRGGRTGLWLHGHLSIYQIFSKREVREGEGIHCVDKKMHRHQRWNPQSPREWPPSFVHTISCTISLEQNKLEKHKEKGEENERIKRIKRAGKRMNTLLLFTFCFLISSSFLATTRVQSSSRLRTSRRTSFSFCSGSTG